MKMVLILISAFAVTGCSGKLYTVVNPDILEDGTSKVRGVLVYNTINVIELYKTTVLVDKSSGNQLGSEPSDCAPDKLIKFSTRTDFNNPNIVVYEPGLLETNKFGVTLDKGVLSGVNTESNPSAALPAIAALVPFIKAPKAEANFVNPSGKPLCNASPKLVGVYHAPDILPFDQIDN
ncbi:MAG: hypothetical protein OQL19_17930 [Gammaproteobacteria bacterium]|nr:hypothetical protein [Gammaproteobacteria bacterium]